MTVATANPRSIRHHAAVLQHIPADRPFSLVELGVAAGELSGALLDARPMLSLTMVDTWAWHGPESPYRQWCERHRDPNGVRTADQVVADERAAAAVAGRYPRHCRVIRGDTVQAAWNCTRQVNAVFVDADHSEAGCARDIEAWWPLVVEGGWIGGHDFRRPGFDGGVELAVRAFVAANPGLSLVEGDGWTWFVHKPIGGAP